MTNFVDPFGGAIPPAQQTYESYNITGNVQLYWPTQYDGSVGLLSADILEFSSDTTNRVISLPPANQTSRGEDLLIRNVGAFDLLVHDFDGGAVGVIAAGEASLIYVTSNLTTAGIWATFTYGTGTSSADAAVLAGFGLKAINTTLNLNNSYKSISSNYSVLSEDRAKILELVSGSLVVTLPQASTVGDGFAVMIHNSAAGSSSIDGYSTEEIDGGLTKTLFPGESAIFICNGTYWLSVGYGKDSTFVFSEFVVNMALGTATLSSSDVSGRMIRLAGTASGNITINLPAIDNIYFINVEAGLGSFGATFTTGSGSTIEANANTRTVLYCDGTNVSIAITTSLISSLSLNDGSAAAPTVTFALDTDLGLYRPGNNQLGITAGGSQSAQFTVNGIQEINGASGTPSYSFISDPDTGLFSGGVNILGVTAGGVQCAKFTTTGLQEIDGSLANPSYSFINDPDTGIFRDSANQIKVSCGGTLITYIDSTGVNLQNNLTLVGNTRKLLGDFSNATLNNQASIQTSTLNGDTSVGATPNGTGNTAGYRAYGGTDRDNSTYLSLRATQASACVIEAGKAGTGTYAPLQHYTSGTLKFTISADATGTFTFEGTSPRLKADLSNASPSSRLLFQTSTLNGNSNLGVAPDGTGNSGSLIAYNSSDVANSGLIAALIDGTSSRVESGRTGGGTYLPLDLYTAGAQRVRVDTLGRFMVGKTTSGLSTAGLEYDTTTGQTYMKQSSSPVLSIRRDDEGQLVQIFRGITQVGSISVTTTATSYNTSSDYRLKENIQDLLGSGNFIDSLRPRSYTWKVNGERGVGFIAHELQEVSPGSVTGTKDAVDEEGHPVHQAVEYGSAEVIAHLVAEVQSLRKRTAELEDLIQRLGEFVGF